MEHAGSVQVTKHEAINQCRKDSIPGMFYRR